MDYEEDCISCGMPLDDDEDLGIETEDGLFCKYCIDSNDIPRSAEEIFEGGVEFFMHSIPWVDRILAEKVTRKNMNKQPFWEGKKDKCLIWDEATDDEFDAVLERLQDEIEKGEVEK